MDGKINKEFHNPNQLVFLLQLAGEFCEQDKKEEIWKLAAPIIEPKLDPDSGEFTLGLNLSEPHPRGQLNARMMSGWVCGQGAWSQIFNQPNLTKFDEPTVHGVDFPSVALSKAIWDGESLHLSIQPKNEKLKDTVTEFTVSSIDSNLNWTLVDRNGVRAPLKIEDRQLKVRARADNTSFRIESVSK